jgi:hypothetical protein
MWITTILQTLCISFMFLFLPPAPLSLSLSYLTSLIYVWSLLSPLSAKHENLLAHLDGLTQAARRTTIDHAHVCTRIDTVETCFSHPFLALPANFLFSKKTFISLFKILSERIERLELVPFFISKIYLSSIGIVLLGKMFFLSKF